MFESLHDNKRLGGTDVYYFQWHGTIPMYVRVSLDFGKLHLLKLNEI